VTYLEEGSTRYVDTIQQVKGTIERGFFNRMAQQGLISEQELRASMGNGKVARSADGGVQKERKSIVNDVFISPIISSYHLLFTCIAHCVICRCDSLKVVIGRH
jgi:hypothetical protein